MLQDTITFHQGKIDRLSLLMGTNNISGRPLESGRPPPINARSAPPVNARPPPPPPAPRLPRSYKELMDMINPAEGRRAFFIRVIDEGIMDMGEYNISYNRKSDTRGHFLDDVFYVTGERMNPILLKIRMSGDVESSKDRDLMDIKIEEGVRDKNSFGTIWKTVQEGTATAPRAYNSAAAPRSAAATAAPVTVINSAAATAAPVTVNTIDPHVAIPITTSESTSKCNGLGCTIMGGRRIRKTKRRSTRRYKKKTSRSRKHRSSNKK